MQSDASQLHRGIRCWSPAPAADAAALQGSAATDACLDAPHEDCEPAYKKLPDVTENAEDYAQTAARLKEDNVHDIATIPCNVRVSRF